MKLVRGPDGGEYLVAARPARMPVEPASQDTVLLDMHIEGDRVLGGLAELWWRLFKKGPWLIEVRVWPDGAPESQEQVPDHAKAKARYRALAALVEEGRWPEPDRS